MQKIFQHRGENFFADAIRGDGEFIIDISMKRLGRLSRWTVTHETFSQMRDNVDHDAFLLQLMEHHIASFKQQVDDGIFYFIFSPSPAP